METRTHKINHNYLSAFIGKGMFCIPVLYGVE